MDALEAFAEQNQNVIDVTNRLKAPHFLGLNRANIDAELLSVRRMKRLLFVDDAAYASASDYGIVTAVQSALSEVEGLLTPQSHTTFLKAMADDVQFMLSKDPAKKSTKCMIVSKMKVLGRQIQPMSSKVSLNFPYSYQKTEGYLLLGRRTTESRDTEKDNRCRTKPADTFEYAHRLVLWAMHGGPPTRDLEHAMHSCNNPACVRPGHLVWGGVKENLSPVKRRVKGVMCRYHKKRSSLTAELRIKDRARTKLQSVQGALGLNDL